MNLQPFLNALVALYDADAAVQAVTGRTSFNLAPRGAQVHDGNLPIATYFVVVASEASMAGHAFVTVRVEVWADVNKANLVQNLETLMGRAEALFTGPNLTTESIDAWVNPVGLRRDGIEADGVRSIIREFRFDVAI